MSERGTFPVTRTDLQSRFRITRSRCPASSSSEWWMTDAASPPDCHMAGQSETTVDDPNTLRIATALRMTFGRNKSPPTARNDGRNAVTLGNSGRNEDRDAIVRDALEPGS